MQYVWWTLLLLTYNPKNVFNWNDQDRVELSDSPCKVGNYNTKVKYGAVSKTELEIIHNDIIVHSKDTISISSDDNDSVIKEEVFCDNDITLKFKGTEDITFRGSKKYINPDIFNIPVMKLNSVPDDINNLVVYEVPVQETLANCKSLRLCCTSQTSNSSTFTKVPRLSLNCRGSYICTNTRCPNIQDFGVNCHDFIMKNFAAHCFICDSVTEFIKCSARLIIKKDLSKNVALVKHHGLHTCSIKVKDI